MARMRETPTAILPLITRPSSFPPFLSDMKPRLWHAVQTWRWAMRRAAMAAWLALLPLVAWAQSPDLPFLSCADLSVLDQLEQAGAVYQDAQGPADPLILLRERGLNTVRLRLWHTPASGQDGLEEVLAMAERIHGQNLNLMLTIHYSDTWADPAQQTKPAAWSAAPFSALRDSVRSYTERVVAALASQGTPPALLQIGNEITGGMLWPDGRVGGTYDTPAQWQQLAGLLQAGIDGARAADDRVAIVLHVDDGGSPETVRWFFDHIRNAGVEFDVIGLSYYPWWHGSLADLERTLDTAAAQYQRPVLVVETAYPWTLGWFDDTHNIVGLPEQLLPDFSASPEGQAAFIAHVREAVVDVADDLGQGLCYWAPEHIATTSVGSPWENLALFDDAGTLLPGAEALGRGLSTVALEPLNGESGVSIAVHPNPASAQLTLHVATPVSVCPAVAFYNMLGQRQGELLLACGAVARQVLIDTSAWVPGIYSYTITTRGRLLGRGQVAIVR